MKCFDSVVVRVALQWYGLGLLIPCDIWLDPLGHFECYVGGQAGWFFLGHLYHFFPPLRRAAPFDGI